MPILGGPSATAACHLPVANSLDRKSPRQHRVELRIGVRGRELPRLLDLACACSHIPSHALDSGAGTLALEEASRARGAVLLWTVEGKALVHNHFPDTTTALSSLLIEHNVLNATFVVAVGSALWLPAAVTGPL